MKRLRKLSVPLIAAFAAALSLVSAPATPAQAADVTTISATAGTAAEVANTGQASTTPSDPGVIPNIVGGQPATEPYPFEGTLLLDRGDGKGPQFHCGLNLVAKEDGVSWFAGAAHCGSPQGKPTLYSPSVLRVTLGGNFRSQHTVYPVSRVEAVPFWAWTPHPGPNGEQGDALLVGVPALVPARPLLIAPSKVNDPLRVIGWGLTSSPPSSLPDQLQQIDLHHIAAKYCTAAKPGIATDEFCTDNPNGKGMCFGDSGAGALRKIAGRWFLVGSVSRGVKDDQGICGGNDNPGILTSWWYYLTWLAPIILGPDWKSRVAAQALPASASQMLPPGAGDTDRQRMQIAYALAG